MEIRVIATREVGFVIIESGSVTCIGDLELITNSKPEIAEAGDMAGTEPAR